MIADQAERDRTLDAGKSFIVEAPAGSGKTGLLVQRYLKLLSVVDRPESVVAMTFTRKAASEMKMRVLQALENASDPALTQPDDYKKTTCELAAAVLQRDQAKGWKLREDASRLQIQTIDSLCALLTRQMPILSEFGGFGEVIEEAGELYLRTAREMLTRLAEGDEAGQALFRRMVLHFDNDVSKLEGHIVKMLSKRDQWEHLDPSSDTRLVQDCCVLLRLAEEQLRRVFQRAGKVDFTEIARAARRALGTPEQPSDLLYALDYRLQHLLVDEFQDTSRSQYELVKALTEQWSLGDDHTLFLVGDPMQSIYRFREADVSLFLKCWEEERIGGVQLERVQLTTNFRSTQQILKWVDANVGPMMPENDRQNGAVKFRSSVAGRSIKGTVPRLVAHIEDKGADEAAEILDIIRKREKRKVAILVRSRNQTAHILPALRKAEIPYEAVDIEMLRDQQHIIDLLSLTRALTNVADRVSWLACLRAPWCGLTLADLAALAEGRREQIVLDLLSDPDVIQSLSVDGRWRAIRIQEIMSDAVSKVGRMRLRDLVTQTWHSLGGLAATQESNQREDVATLLRLIEESEDGGVIRDFSLLNKKLEFLYARPAVTDGSVVIMTIYQAKGLEFDVVILPQIDRKVRGYESEMLVWAQKEDAGGMPQLALAAIPQTGVEDPKYDEITNQLKLKDENEARRLFYVACTRAMNELHLIGSVGRKQDGTCRTPSSGTFLRMLWDGSEQIREEFAARMRRQVTSQQTSFAFGQAKNKVLLRRLPLNWAAPALAKNIEIQAPIRHATASERPVSYRWAGDTRRHAGTVVHEILKRVAAEGLAAWNDRRVASMRGFMESELVRLGVPAEDKKAASDQVLQALRNSLHSERGRWILSPHADARSEWAIVGRVNGSLVSGTVDRCFRDSDGTYWIIDFKNSEHSGGRRDEFLANEKQRYRPQLDQYAAVVSGLVSGRVKLGLYFPGLDEWLEWEFTESVAAGV